MEDEGLRPDELIAFAKQFESETAANSVGYYDAQVLEDLIDYYIEKGSGNLAMAASMAGIQLHPHETVFYGRCAQLLNQSDRFLAALGKVRESLAINPSNMEHILLKAQILEKLGRYDDAIEAYNQAEELGGDPDEIRLNKARNYGDLGEEELGLKLLGEIFSKPLESEHLFYEALLFIGDIQQWDRGIEILTAYLDLDPFSAMGWCALGHVYNEKNDFEKAIWAYDFATAIEEHFSDAHIQKGFCYSELGDFEKAAEEFHRYMELEEPDAPTHTSIGDCFRAMNELDPAEWHYQQALDRDPEYSEAWFGLGMIEAIREDPDSAIRSFNRCLDLCPDDDLYRIHLIHYFMRIEYWAQAETLLKKIVKVRKHYQNAFIWLATVQNKQEKITESLKTLEIWLRKKPDDDQVMYQLAAYLLRDGQDPEGQYILEEALRLNPKNSAVFYEFAPELQEDGEIARLIKSHTQE